MPTPLSAVILDPETTRLSVNEKAFFRDLNPYGYILFARHCGSPDEVRRIVGELKSLSGRDRLPILIDQEGGRVARLKPPHWPKYSPAGVFARMAASDRDKAHRATYLNARLIAHDLYELGITVNCAPLADLPVAGAHDIIGDRAFGREAEQVIYLARAQAAGLMEGGIVPVLKHIPGHGRAFADSHHELPEVNEPLEVLRQTDFVPFAALSNLPMAMTAHVLYTAIDGEHMATLSKKIIGMIRKEMGFKGLLMSDDLSMKAMGGPLDQRARDALAAGCDVVLHCNGSLRERRKLADGVGPLEGEALARAEKAMKSVKPPKTFDVAQARASLDEMLVMAA